MTDSTENFDDRLQKERTFRSPTNVVNSYCLSLSCGRGRVVAGCLQVFHRGRGSERRGDIEWHRTHGQVLGICGVFEQQNAVYRLDA
eukprot:1311208-Amphidinium_carterae.1